MSTDRYAGYLGDGLHLLDTADGDLGYPEGAGDVGPLLPAARALHSTTLFIVTFNQLATTCWNGSVLNVS